MNITPAELHQLESRRRGEPDPKPRAKRFTGTRSKAKQRRLDLLAQCYHARTYGGVYWDGGKWRIVLPRMRIESTPNRREHWAVKRERNREQCDVLAHFLIHVKVAEPIEVKLTRVGPRLLDDDNNTASFKAIRDHIARYFGIDDGDKSRIRFICDQRRDTEYAVVIEITTVTTPDIAYCATATCQRRSLCLRGMPPRDGGDHSWAAFDPETCKEAL